MTRLRAVTVGTLVATMLAFAPVTATAGGYYRGGHHGGYHGGSHHGGHGYYGGGYRYGWPLFGLAAAVVGTAAAIVTAPIALVAAAANAPYYPPQSYAAPRAASSNRLSKGKCVRNAGR